MTGVWLVNTVFAILCLGFYGDQTQDLVLANLDNGPYLSALKILLCVDLLFTFPIVLSSGRLILEDAILGKPSPLLSGENNDNDNDNKISSFQLSISRAAIAAAAVSACFGLAQIGGFGAVANLVGGVAQGTLAFIMPPAIAVTLARRNNNSNTNGNIGQATSNIGASAGGREGESEVAQLLLGAFGVALVSSVTYFTAVGLLE